MIIFAVSGSWGDVQPRISPGLSGLA